MSKPSSGLSRSAWFLIATISFLSDLGMTIVFPVLPFITRQYVSNPSILALWVGVLQAVYALCAFVSAPFLGKLSDRVGRRPVLIVSLLGSAVGYVLFGIGGAMWVLALGRVIDGLTAGNIAVLFAYVADVTPPEDRAARFGLLGALQGIGFIAGPALGGLLTHFGLAAPVFVAAGITTVTVLLSLFVLPETLAPEKRSKTTPSVGEILPFKSIGAAFKRAELRPLLFVFLLAGIPNNFFETNVNVLAMDAVAWGPTQVGLLISGIGVADIVVQGGLLRLLLKRLGERGVILVGMAAMALGCAALALVGGSLPVVWPLVAGGLLLAGAEGGMQAALQGLLTSAVHPDEQGWLAGTRDSLHSAIAVLAPLLGGWLYSKAGHATPYWIGVVMILAAIFVGARSLSGKGGTPRPEEASSI